MKLNNAYMSVSPYPTTIASEDSNYRWVLEVDSIITESTFQWRTNRRDNSWLYSITNDDDQYSLSDRGTHSSDLIVTLGEIYLRH